MRHERLLSAVTRGSVAAFFILSLSLAACGGGGGASSGGVIEIATDLPVSGTDAAQGLPTQYGVDLAVSQAKLGGGYTLQVVHKNDEGASGADPTVGASNISALLADPKVMAVVGPFNSGVAKAEIPVATNGGLVLMSPTNTNPGLTKSQYAQANGINFAQLHPSGSKEYYFRVCATDDVQGKVDAQIAAAAPISAKSVYVVDDDTTYGKGLADFFISNFKSNGGTVLGRQSITPAQVGNLNSLATTIANTNPDVVFYGGVTSQGGGALKKDLVAANYNKAMVGGDGIADDPSWLQTAGSAAVNTYGTVAAPDPSSLTSSDAQAFKSAYTTFVQGKPDNDLLPYSAQAYAAATIEINAIKSLISSGKAVTRANVRDAIASSSTDTIIGTITFDQNGDNSGQKVFSIYTVDSTGKWVFDKSVTA
ncbi:MAG TPA: branched-chain amino acid ABC transporter substrate-binding protein [Ktedonobacterales bacterium]|jgi:branched-chain amino acid transport system substrate-binding protein|nr:branched-chain amino acid ABC transporter substrate-binding protein [Ktedonobacterales bacterium]